MIKLNENAKTDYITVVYSLLKYNEMLMKSYNEAIQQANNVNEITSENDYYQLAGLIGNLGFALEISELLGKIDSLKKTFNETYETGVYLNQNGLLTNTELNSIKQAMININKVDTENWEVKYDYLKQMAKDIASSLEINTEDWG